MYTFYFIATATFSGIEYIQGGKVINNILQEFFQIVEDGSLIMGDMAKQPSHLFLIYKYKGWKIQKITETKYRMIVRLGDIR